MPPKSGFSRTRNIDYDDDDDDDVYDDEDEYYEEGEGGDALAEDDKESMRLGTISVREGLGEMSGFTSDAQIQEALWHYYYDVEKSVVYLKNKLGTESKPEKAMPKKEKATTRFDQAASVAGQKAPTPTGKQTHTQYSCLEESAYLVAHLSLPPISMPTNDATDDFFWDVPWGHVPSHRLGVITVIAPQYRRGLPGGSSKLAALAAKRRKEREEAEAAASKASSDADAAITMLDKLTVKSKDPAPILRGSDEERPTRAKYPARRRAPSPSPSPEAPIHEMQESEAPRLAIINEAPAQRAVASMFASTLCGDGNAAVATTHPLSELQTFSAPYAKYKDYDSAKAFASPSPDDVVRAAQAKGAGGGRR